MRCGYAIGAPNLINPMQYKTKDNCNMDFMSQVLQGLPCDTCMCVRICVHVHVHVCTYLRVCVRARAFVHACVRVCTCVSFSVFVCACVSTCVCVHACVYVTCVCVCVCSLWAHAMRVYLVCVCVCLYLVSNHETFLCIYEGRVHNHFWIAFHKKIYSGFFFLSAFLSSTISGVAVEKDTPPHFFYCPGLFSKVIFLESVWESLHVRNPLQKNCVLTDN